MSTTTEDLKVLKYAGGMGHHFAGVAGQPGSRQLVMEADDPRRITTALEGARSLTVYARMGREWAPLSA